MTTPLEWARYGWKRGPCWLDSLHPADGTKLARIIAVCNGAWLTSRHVAGRTGINPNTVYPLLYAAARKRLLLRRRADGTRARWAYRLPGT